MPIVSAFFLSTQDLHLIRGQNSPSLDTLLHVRETEDGDSFAFADFRHDHAEVVIEFRPVFKAPLSQEEFKAFGIRVRNWDGRITTPGPFPDFAPQNFIVEATVKQNGNGVPPSKIAKVALRVFLHNSLQRIWLTPREPTHQHAGVTGQLSVRPPVPAGPTNYRFTVRGQFDDDTVADLTFSEQLSRPDVDAPFLTSSLMIQIPPGTAAGTVRKVTISTSAALNSRSSQGLIKVLAPWTGPTTPRAEWLSGPAGILDGSIKPERMPNILFIATGFPEADRASFEEKTDLIVHELRTNVQLVPYKYLASSMNYWRLFIPALEAGVSVRCEVYSIVKDGQRFARPVRCPELPAASDPAWKIEHLIYAVGLPVPADLARVFVKASNQPPATVEDLGALKVSELDFSRLLDKWKQIVRDEWVSVLDGLTLGLLKEWISMANRTFIDEVDNFPSISIGEPPGIPFDDTGLIDFHVLRGGESDPEINPQHELRALFRRITAAPRHPGTPLITLDGPSPGNEIGRLWAEDRPATVFAFDNRGFPTPIINMPIGLAPAAFFGRSRRVERKALFVRPTSKPVGTGKEFPGLPVSTDLNDPTRRALVAVPVPLAACEFQPETWEVAAHELGHSFALGDEYTPKEAASDEPTEESLAGYGNLTLCASIVNPDQTVRLDQVKWNWLRISKAATVVGPIVPQNNGKFLVPTSPNSPFKKDDLVLLRNRPARSVINRPAVLSSKVSGEFNVESVAKANAQVPFDHVLIVPRAPGGNLTGFDPGSVIFTPVLAPATVTPQRPYLTLVPPAAERIMKAIGGTMSGTVCDVQAEVHHRSSVKAPRLPVSQLLHEVSQAALPSLVGAFFGGGQDVCRIVHPAASCLMGRHYLTRAPRDVYANLCPVCRYIMVDQIDPSQHALIDRDYAKIYPF